MSTKTLALSLLALSCGLTASLSAGVIYSNGLPNQSSGTDLNANLGADDFTVGVNSTVNLIRYWTLQSSAADYAGTTEWSILTDAAGSPGAAVVGASGLTAGTQATTGNSALGLNEYVHELPVSFNLAAGA